MSDTPAKPVIGITTDHDAAAENYALRHTYTRAVRAAGGVPLLLPYGDPTDAPAMLARVDGLLMAGGNDPDPHFWGEPWHKDTVPVDPRREAFERALIAAARHRRTPTLGVCLGMQLMAIVENGGLIQFLPDEPRDDAIDHRRLTDRDWHKRHPIAATPGSRLAAICGETFRVNSNHRQSVRRTDLAVVGLAPDGVIEAVEDADLPLWLGVQWHPERLIDQDHGQFALFQTLVKTAREAADR